MTRFGLALAGLSLLPACAAGEPWRITDSAETLGDEDEGGTEEESGPAISASASASASTSSTGPDTDTTDATTQPVDGSSDAGGESSTTTGVSAESSSGSTGTGVGSSSTGDPTTIDLSGWSIVQTESERTFDIPDGTTVPVGGALVIARDVDQAAFETYWGITFGDDVVFLSGANAFPTINGDETYTLRDAASTIVDGPSPPLVLGESLERVDPEDGGATGWASASADVGTPSPGTSVEPPAGFTGVFLSEASDANGNGNFIYEFVELRAF